MLKNTATIDLNHLHNKHMTPNDKLKLLVEEIDKLKQELAQKAQDGPMQCLKELFEMHPEVKKLQFTAYTPYWNDGDECTYWCNASSACINTSINGDEEWKELVGDHCIVMIDRKGIHVEEYSHD